MVGTRILAVLSPPVLPLFTTSPVTSCNNETSFVATAKPVFYPTRKKNGQKAGKKRFCTLFSLVSPWMRNLLNLAPLVFSMWKWRAVLKIVKELFFLVAPLLKPKLQTKYKKKEEPKESSLKLKRTLLVSCIVTSHTYPLSFFRISSINSILCCGK